MFLRDSDANVVTGPDSDGPEQAATVMVVGDNPNLLTTISVICDFLDLGIEHIPSSGSVRQALMENKPAVVLTEAVGIGQDGYNVLMEIGRYDRSLPVLLLTGREGALVGAAEAVTELCHLEAVTISEDLPAVGDLVSFLIQAIRRSGSSQLMPL